MQYNQEMLQSQQRLRKIQELLNEQKLLISQIPRDNQQSSIKNQNLKVQEMLLNQQISVNQKMQQEQLKLLLDKQMINNQQKLLNTQMAINEAIAKKQDQIRQKLLQYYRQNQREYSQIQQIVSIRIKIGYQQSYQFIYYYKLYHLLRVQEDPKKKTKKETQSKKKQETNGRSGENTFFSLIKKAFGFSTKLTSNSSQLDQESVPLSLQEDLQLNQLKKDEEGQLQFDRSVNSLATSPVGSLSASQKKEK